MNYQNKRTLPFQVLAIFQNINLPSLWLYQQGQKCTNVVLQPFTYENFFNRNNLYILHKLRTLNWHVKHKNTQCCCVEFIFSLKSSRAEVAWFPGTRRCNCTPALESLGVINHTIFQLFFKIKIQEQPIFITEVTK